MILAVEKQEIQDILEILKGKIKYYRHEPLVKAIQSACHYLDNAINFIDKYTIYLKNLEKNKKPC